MAGTAAAAARAIGAVERPAAAPAAPGRAPRWGARPALPHEVAERLVSARELDRARREERREPLPTGVAALDRPLGGGLPRGELVELVGRRSGGRFSAALAAVAAATAAGEAAALVDLGDGLEPAAAAALGADLERLLWVRPRALGEALAAAEAALHGGFHLVVLDLGMPPVPGARGLGSAGAAAWARLARAAKAHGSALLVASPYRISGTAAAAVLEAAARPEWSRPGAAPPLLTGLAARVRTARPLRGGRSLRANPDAAEGDNEALPLAADGSIGGGQPCAPAEPERSERAPLAAAG